LWRVNDAQIEEILRDRNPWWRRERDWADDDDVLREAAQAPFLLHSDVLNSIAAPSLYVLLGPRRVGKSLAMRRKILQLISAGVAHPRAVVYCSCDGFSPQDLRRLFKVGRALTRPPEDAPRWWFIDEVTAVGEDWSAIVKDVRGDTPARRDCVVLTGSSARGLREAVDHLAGRRGPDSAASDRLLMPVGFRRFCDLLGLQGPDQPPLRPNDLLTRSGAEALDELAYWTEDLVTAWETYLRIGGYPRAIADFLREGDVSAGFARDLWDVVRGDAIRKADLPDVTILALLERLGENLASPVNASKVARDTDLGSNHRVNDRVHDLTVNFLTWRCLQQVSGRPNVAAQRKVYFTDPLTARLASVVDDRRRPPAVSKLAEQQLGLALALALDRRTPGSFALGSRLMYQRTTSGKEIDFVSPDFEGCVEGKYVDDGWKSDARTAASAYDRGVLATRRKHDLSSAIWATPAASLAWLLDTKPNPGPS